MRRWFGASLAAVLLLLGAIVWWRGHVGWAWALWIAAGLLGFCYYAFRGSQIPIVRGWLWLTFPIAWVFGHLLLAAIYYGLVTPLGCWRRWRGHDPLAFRGEADASYWRARGEPPSADRYFRQF
jgi:hypothetical protein